MFVGYLKFVKKSIMKHVNFLNFFHLKEPNFNFFPFLFLNPMVWSLKSRSQKYNRNIVTMTATSLSVTDGNIAKQYDTIVSIYTESPEAT